MPMIACMTSVDAPDIFGSYMPGYTSNRLDLLRRRTVETHAAFLLPHLASTSRVLDCGCGPGTITVGLAARAFAGEVVGIDIGAHQVRETAALARSHGLSNLQVDLQDVRCLGFPDSTFDVVLAHALLEHLEEPRAALAEMWRVLRPSGLLALRSPNWKRLILRPRSEAVEAYLAAARSRLARCPDVLAPDRFRQEFFPLLPGASLQFARSTELPAPADLFLKAVAEVLRMCDDHDPRDAPNPADDQCRSVARWLHDGRASVQETWDEVLATKPDGAPR